MADDRELDAILDEAFASYANEEPDPSLRARIMARAAEPPPSQKRLWLFALAAACTAALVIAFLLHPSTDVPRPHPFPATSTASAPQSRAAVKAVPQRTLHPHPALAAHRTRRSERPTPMRAASFPSPTPLTTQESILLKFATEHPDQARQVLAAPASRPVENAPLAIASIQIPALSETQETQHSQ